MATLSLDNCSINNANLSNLNFVALRLQPIWMFNNFNHRLICRMMMAYGATIPCLQQQSFKLYGDRDGRAPRTPLL